MQLKCENYDICGFTFYRPDNDEGCRIVFRTFRRRVGCSRDADADFEIERTRYWTRHVRPRQMDSRSLVSVGFKVPSFLSVTIRK